MTFDFRKMIETDQENILMNMGEFAEMHNLNGADCKAVVQSPSSRDQFTKPAEAFGEIPGRSVVVFVRREYLPDMPIRGNRYDLDGKMYIVQACENAAGMLKITLGADGI